MSREKFAVIGSNSFSGANFVAHLLKANTEVIGISRSPEPADVFLPYKWISNNGFHFYQLDLNYDLEKIMNVIEEFHPDYIVSFAAQSMVAQSWVRPEDWFMTNIVAMVKFHDQLRRCTFLKKYVHISTPEVYGNITGLIKEDTLYKPSTPYAVSRASCDMSLHSFFKAYNFPVVFIRAANVCGPGQQLYRILPKTIISILLGKKLKLEGAGSSMRSFIHIRDVCDGTFKVAEQGRSGEVYHLATDRYVSIRQLVQMVCQMMGVSFENYVEIVPTRLGEDAAYMLDSRKARTELDWPTVFSLEDTIAETIEWVKSKLHILKMQPMEYVHKR